MAAPFRVIDTGPRGGRENIAFDQALIECHQAGIVPDTVRFMHFPPTVLIGRHQSLSDEVRLDYCRENGIGTVRRITGGGAIYLDPGQLGWELVFHRRALGAGALSDLAGRICHAVAAGLRRLGVDAAFRPRNDVEVGGRKISGTGGFFDGDTMIYQGTVLVDLDAEVMASALNVPRAKLARRDLDSAARRVVTLRELLGEATPPLAAVQQALLEGFATGLGIAPSPGEIHPEEERRARRAFDEEIGTDAFVSEIDAPHAPAGTHTGRHDGPGGTVAVHLRVETTGRPRVREALVTGDFFVTPPRVVFDLEAALRGVPLDEAADAVTAFFERTETGMLSAAPGDFRAALEAALRAHAGGE